MDSEKKKALLDAYKQKEIIGGVYCIECEGNHRKLIKSTRDLDSIKNRYDFGMSINSCPEPDFRKEWNTYGAQSFSYSVLETLKKTEDQTDREYADDLKALLEMCREKYGQQQRAR